MVWGPDTTLGFRKVLSWAGIHQRSAKQRTVGRIFAEEARIQRERKAQTGETAEGVCWGRRATGAVFTYRFCYIFPRPSSTHVVMGPCVPSQIHHESATPSLGAVRRPSLLAQPERYFLAGARAGLERPGGPIRFPWLCHLILFRYIV